MPKYYLSKYFHLLSGLLVCAVFTCFIGLCYLLFDPIVKQLVLRRLVLRNNSEFAEIWENPPITPHLKVKYYYYGITYLCYT